jgi:hypothetical protein
LGMLVHSWFGCARRAPNRYHGIVEVEWRTKQLVLCWCHVVYVLISVVLWLIIWLSICDVM